MRLKVNLERSTQQNISDTAANIPSHKPSKWDEQDMLGTKGEERTNSSATFSDGLLHMDTPV